MTGSRTPNDWSAKRAILLVLVLLLGGGCDRSTERGADARSEPGLPAEERFGNDQALVQRVAKLHLCSYQSGLIDSTCPQLLELQGYLRQCDAEPSRRKTASATLIALLQSKKELTRLAATEALARFATSRALNKALLARLEQDTAVQVKAAALRQLCWRDAANSKKRALRLLAPLATETGAEPLRLAAAACLARQGPLPPGGEQALLAALPSEPRPEIQARLCAALGQSAGEAALPALIPLLDKPKTAGPCSTAAASIGNQAAYQALLAVVQKGASSPALLHPQHLAALQALADEPFAQTSELSELFAQVAAAQAQGWELRCRALQLLKELGAQKKLRQLREQLQGLPCRD